MICSSPQQPIVVSECQINDREKFRIEVCPVKGRDVVRLSRWKMTPAGEQRAGTVFEFGAHRAAGISKLMDDLEAFLSRK